MKHTYSLLLFFLLPFLPLIAGGHTISGKVVNNRNQPVKGASVYLDNTIDGGTTDSVGFFSFTTDETGNQTIVASEVSHATAGQPIVINGDVTGILITLKANMSRDLDAVVITAGSIDATNDKSKTVLKPLDIVTTAGSGADVVKAMQMLPGTQQTGPDNGLFVRGGDANEAAVIVDEMVVQNAFFSGAPGVATRSRFGAFQYQGVAFSSGGYSARYSQALSGILELNTTDLPDKSTINLGVNMAGAYASGVKKWKNSSLDVGGGYTNLSPFYEVVKSNFKFYKVPQGGNGNIRYAWKPNKDGILKVTLNTQHNLTGVSIPNPMRAGADTLNFLTKDQNYYSNVSYKQMFKHKYMLYTAASVSRNKTRSEFSNVFNMDNVDYRNQFRIEGKRYMNSRLNLLVGTDVQNFGQERTMEMQDSAKTIYKQDFNEVLTGGYAELEWVPVNRFAIKPGVRYEHSTLMNVDKVAPRLSMAIKTGSHSQASLAGGMFYQQASNFYLIAPFMNGYNDLDMQVATHYIANWQWSQDNRTLRLEGYYKKYDKLVLEEGAATFDPNTYRVLTPASNITLTNNGSGYAQGLELFWRDKKTIKNADYWVSYSYIDTRRRYMNYPTQATPTFIANHNLNVVGKYWIDKLKTSVNATYSFASGRPYYNPNIYNVTDHSNFQTEVTPDYHSLSLSAAYLRSFGKWFTVFYISVDNVTRQKNVFGYRYGANGEMSKIVPALYRTVFFGVNMSLSEFSKDEL
ncbi:TonB-dependent receptor [Nemorincola caseinilytica]|uniref:TonB-dependent receptor n=1 Tax=Nemorincola caseinilytica TaxID=2054315 RepID=A0ABP8NAW6_9BACT